MRLDQEDRLSLLRMWFLEGFRKMGIKQFIEFYSSYYAPTPKSTFLVYYRLERHGA